MPNFENHFCYADLLKGFLILGQPCPKMFQLGVLLKVVYFQFLSVFLFLLFKSKPTIADCDLKTVFHRLTMHLWLTTGQGDETIKCLNLYYIKTSNDTIVLFVFETLKTTKPDHHLQPKELKTFKDIE